MHLEPYLESVRGGVQNAAALADDRTRQVADQLSTALESTVRLTLVQALSDATAEISTELAPSAVTLRMDGSEPRFDVTVADSGENPAVLLAEDPDPEPDEPTGEDEAMARISLRIPQSLKDRVDQLADEQGVSTNVWITQAIGLISRRSSRRDRDGRDRDGRDRDRRRDRSRGRGGWGGWDGPMADLRDGDDPGRGRPDPSPEPPFPPGFPFGPRHGHRGPRGGRGGPDLGGTVQGWVR